MTYGKESAPVQVVNAFDYEYPPYVEYSSQRIAGSGVHLNTDDEFLVGCDCEDDCRVSTGKKTRRAGNRNYVGNNFRRHYFHYRTRQSVDAGRRHILESLLRN